MSMNAPFNGPIPPVDLHGTSDRAALLALLVDPEKTKARLDELIAQEKATQERIDALNEMAADTRRLNSAAQALNIVSDNRKTALDAREAEIQQRAEQLELSEATRSDAALRRREAACTAQTEANKRETERLAAIRTDYEAKLAQIAKIKANL
jgi:hypothetical protein